MLVALTAELRAFRLQHCGDGMQPELVDQPEQVAANECSERHQ
jgi:hypothetical protein